MNEDKATRYHRLRRRALLLAALWRVSLLTLLLVTGLSHRIRDLSLAIVQPLPSALRFPASVFVWVAAVALVQELGAWPAAFFGGFVLERRYGLSRQPASAWMRDHLKAAAVNLALVGLAAVWVYVWIRAAPGAWWIPAWIGLLAAGIATTWAAPVVLLPLFYRFVPLSDDALRRRLLGLAERAGVPALGVFEWRTSERTSRANAALTGMGRTRRIILSDTLIADCRQAEVEAVLAHEMAHHVHHDIWKALAIDALAVLAAVLAADAALRAAAGLAGLRALWDPAGLPLVALAVTAVAWLASPIQNAVSRAHERRADRFALDLTQDPWSFVSAMRRLGARNLAEESPALLARVFFHTHPPIGERIALAKAWEAGQGRRARIVQPAADEVTGGGA